MASIGEVARQHGVPAHVLRHWEDVGVLTPARTANGHREYGPAHVAQIQLVRCGKTAGMSLEQIRVMLHGDSARRRTVLDAHDLVLARRAEEISAARRLLDHAATCSALGAGDCDLCATPHHSFGFPRADQNETAEPLEAPGRSG